MKKTEIADLVFAAVNDVPLRGLAGGELKIPLTDLASLALVPWFCDIAIQWAIRLSQPGVPLPKNFLPKIKGTYVSITPAGDILVGIPGDGIEPSLHVLNPLSAALAAIARPGLKLELATANLGVVKRDWDAKAEALTPFGHQRYSGTLDGQSGWVITESAPALTTTALGEALRCGRMVVNNGPWTVKDKPEAASVLLRWMESPEANINPMAVQRFVTLQDGALVCNDPGMARRLCGLGLGFFRHRLAGGPFQWPPPGPVMSSRQQLEAVVHAIVG